MQIRAIFLLPELLMYSHCVVLYSPCDLFYLCCLMLLRVVSCYSPVVRVISCCIRAVLSGIVTRVVF